VALIEPADLPPVDHQLTDAQVTKWITKAEVRLRSALARRGCDLDQIVLADGNRAALARDVLENAVVRVLRNPEGYKSESEDGYSYTLSALDASGNIWFPANDLDELCPPKRSRVGSINTALPKHRY